MLSEPLTDPNSLTLHSARFILRPMTHADASALFPAFADAAVMQWWSRGPFTSEQELAEWLVPESGWDEGRSWAVAEYAGGPAIGRMAVMDRGDAVSELACLTIPQWQGRGLAREALGTLIHHLFENERQRRLYADVDLDNAASNRLFESLGFTREGVLREAMTTHIGRRDSVIWGLLDRDPHP